MLTVKGRLALLPLGEDELHIEPAMFSEPEPWQVVVRYVRQARATANSISSRPPPGLSDSFWATGPAALCWLSEAK